MTFRTDSGGVAFSCSDIKLQAGASTYGTKLSQLHRMSGTVRIITFSLPDLRYVEEQLGRRPYDIFLIGHEQFRERAYEIKRMFPRIRIALHAKVHSKIVLIEPHLIVVSSANFGRSGWAETSISLHSKPAHDWYVNGIWSLLWTQSSEILNETDSTPRLTAGSRARG